MASFNQWRANDYLSKPELSYYGPSLLKQSHLFCNCSRVDVDTMFFSLKCISDIICHRKYLCLSKKQKNRMKVILNPYKSKLLSLSSTKKRKHIVQKLRSQSGAGIFSGLVLALIPLVTSLVSKWINKKK